MWIGKSCKRNIVVDPNHFPSVLWFLWFLRIPLWYDPLVITQAHPQNIESLTINASMDGGYTVRGSCCNKTTCVRGRGTGDQGEKSPSCVSQDRGATCSQGAQGQRRRFHVRHIHASAAGNATANSGRNASSSNFSLKCHHHDHFTAFTGKDGREQGHTAPRKQVTLTNDGLRKALFVVRAWARPQ